MMPDHVLEHTDECDSVIISEDNYGNAVLEQGAGYEVIIEPQYFRRVAEWFAQAAADYERRADGT